MNITEPGIYRDFPTAAYFADPCPAPSFTQSLAKVLIEQSPLHAYQQHPRLNVQAADEDEGYDKARAIGNAAHSLMLGRGKVLAVGEFADWRKKEAQQMRAAAVEWGQEPILRKHYDVAGEMVEAANKQLDRIHGCERAFRVGNGDAEVVIANREDGIWLRSMLDWITPDLREVWDYKTSGRSASPYATGRLMADAGWHIQAAFHERILDAIDPRGAGRRKFYYVAQENEAPYALTVNEIGEAALTIGRKQVDYAVGIWSHCMRKGRWPAYPLKIIRPELPTWAESSWLGREIEEASENDPSLMFAG